jgi:uncharacterized membrane protein
MIPAPAAGIFLFEEATMKSENAVRQLAQHLLECDYADIPPRERQVIERVAKRIVVAQDTNATHAESLSIGERLADRVASFGGSWTFLLMFGAVLVFWIALNSLALTQAFDPYPYILLNLLLSMVAAVQAPIIMMSQNRQAAKDRLQASHDYEVNLKAEIEIMALHEKLDEMRHKDLAELLRRLKA